MICLGVLGERIAENKAAGYEVVEIWLSFVGLDEYRALLPDTGAIKENSFCGIPICARSGISNGRAWLIRSNATIDCCETETDPAEDDWK